MLFTDKFRFSVTFLTMIFCCKILPMRSFNMMKARCTLSVLAATFALFGKDSSGFIDKLFGRRVYITDPKYKTAFQVEALHCQYE